MISQTDAIKQAWVATDRTLDIVVTIDGKDYPATEINSLNYDAGAFTGDTLGIGSTYENSVTIEFSSVVEAFKQGLTVLPKVGILVNGKFEYTKLGTFIISEVNRDRNNNLTTIKALDQMCKLEGQYKPAVSAMASPLDIIADIANQGGVTVNTGELQHLPTLPNIKKIEGQTLRTAIGWVAQLYGGFAAFDRDGKLTIRTTATPDYTISPSEYQQGGLTKNEVAYKTGGIKVTVNTKKTDDSGQEVDDTTTLQAGETTGSQIELTNDSMTSDLLTTVWTGIKDITYYPYTLNWFGNPGIEAGDWVTLTDTQGNKFNVPINQYTMSFNGGLESTISATQSSSAAGGYAYTGSAGSIKNMIEALQVRHTASGNNVYPPSYQGQPKNPKKGDVWYKQNGNNVEMWIYQETDGKSTWVKTPLDGEVKAELQAMGKKTDEDLTRVKNELSSAAESQWESAKAATSKVANDLSATKSRLEDTRTSLADTRDSLATTASDLSTTKADLEETKTSLATATSEFQRQTGQLSGSLSTANAKIEYNSNAIAEVKHTAEEISTTVSNIRVGGRNLLTNTRTLSDVWNGTTETVDGFTVAKATQTNSGVYAPIQWNDLVVKSNTDYVLTFYAKASKQTTIYSYLYNIGTDTVYADGSTFNTLTTDYQRYVVHFHTATMPADRTVNCLPVRLTEGGVTAWIYGVQLEEGNTATQWQPNPNDTDQEISKVSQKANAIRADLTNTQNDVASVKATASSLTSSVANAHDEISNLQQTASGLQYSVTNAQSDISNLQQRADSITSTLSNGGRNLLSNTREMNDSSIWENLSLWDKGDFYHDGRNDCQIVQTSTQKWNGLKQYVFVEAGIKYTFSIDAKSGDNGNHTAWFFITLNNAQEGPQNKAEAIGDGQTLNYTPTWTRYSFTITATTNGYVAPRIERGTTTNELLQLARPQFECGETATPWQPSNGDIATLQQTAEGLTSSIANAKGDISTLQTTANGLKSTVANQSDKISQLQQDADGLTVTVKSNGHNLLRDTDTVPNWGGDKETVGNFTVVKAVMTLDVDSYDPIAWNYLTTIKPNTDYTLSFWAKADQPAYIYSYLYNIGTDTVYMDGSTWSHLTTSYQRFEIHFHTQNFSAGRTVNCLPMRIITKNVAHYIYGCQLEEGTMATAWSPAPEDVSALKVTAQKLQATVGDDNTGLVSYVKAIPGQISSAITASQQATVITSAVDVHNMTTAGYYLLKGALTNSPVDAWAFLRVITSDSGDRIYHRIWKDNASTVYTEEWTGSWSGWATHINSDNLKSNVITAINQSTEGVSITGNKITLDGNVNVAPGFTLSADHIKAGTLSADRISGGTLNFSNITVNGLTANSISSGSISGQNLNINLDNGVVEFTKGNLHSTDGGFNISIDTKSFYLDMGNDTKLWIDGNGYHLQESATQHLWMNKDGLHNYTDANGNGLWINDTELRILNSKNAGLVAKDGMLQFSANPTWNSPNVYSGSLNSQTYGTIGFNSNLLSSSLNGIFIKGREGVVIGTNSYDGGSLFGADSFLDVGQAGSGINLPDDLNKPASMFTKSALTLLGGPTYPASWGMSDKARISIGCDTYYSHSGASMYSGGNNARGNNISINARNTNIIGYDWVNIKCRNGGVALDGQYVHSYPTYNKTTSAGANVYVADDGALVRSSSARKYKTDIQDADNDYGNKLIELTPQKWIDKAEKKRYEEDPENSKKPDYYYGLIADDLDAAGLDMLVNYGAEGEVEGINYDRLAVALLPVIKSLKDQVASLKKQIKELAK